MFTFAVGTSELRQCFDLTIPLDNLIEQQEFLQLDATSAGMTLTSSIHFIADADGI